MGDEHLHASYLTGARDQGKTLFRTEMARAEDAPAARDDLQYLFGCGEQASVCVQHGNTAREAVVTAVIARGASWHPHLFRAHLDSQLHCRGIQAAHGFIED